MATITLPSPTAPIGTRRRVGAIDGLSLGLLSPIRLLGLLLLRPAVLAVFAGILALIAGLVGIDPTRTMIYLTVVVVGIDVLTVRLLAGLVEDVGTQFRALFGPIRPMPDLLLAIPVTAIALAVFLGARHLAELAAPGALHPPDVPIVLAVWALVVMPVTVAIAEQLLYRGALLHALAARWFRLGRGGHALSVVVVSLAFGLQQAIFGVGSVSSMVARMAVGAVVGATLATITMVLRRLLPVIVAAWVVAVVGVGVTFMTTATQ